MTEPISRRKAVVTLAVMAAGCRMSTGGATNAASPVRPQGADDLQGMLDVAGVPGMSVVEVSRGAVSARGRGMTRATDGRVVDADTVFEAASLSKPVFAYLVLQLAAERALDLDRRLSEYVPLPASDPQSASITARHVLSHSTGWRNWRNTMAQPLTADFVPGSRFGYSGEGFYYLSRVVEKVTGTGILRLTRDRIFQPLGMSRSSYMWAPWMDANRAHPHTNRGVPGTSYLATTSKGYLDAAAAANASLETWTHEVAERLLPAANRDVPVLPNFLLPNVAGSMATTANDYGRFLTRLLEDDAVRGVMMTPQTRINPVIQWGLGMGLQIQTSGTTMWHWGDTFGFKNFVVVDPAKRTAMAVFCNGQNGRAVYERVVRYHLADQPAFLWI